MKEKPSTNKKFLDTFNEADYELTIDQAKLHQSRLSLGGRNKRLPSEAELKAQEEATSRKLSNVKEVEIKIRYPDQTQVVSKFTSTDTITTLYDFVQSMLDQSDQPFLLSYSSAKGPNIIPREEGTAKLIADLGFSGRMLINFIWDEKASDEARLGESVLKREFAAAAKQIRVDETKAEDVGAEDKAAGKLGSLKDKAKDLMPRRDDGKEKKAMPKWLKLPGKK